MPTALLAEFYGELDYEKVAWCDLSPKDVDLSLSEDELYELFWANWIGCKDDGIEAYDGWLAEVLERRDMEVAA